MCMYLCDFFCIGIVVGILVEYTEKTVILYICAYFCFLLLLIFDLMSLRVELFWLHN